MQSVCSCIPAAPYTLKLSFYASWLAGHMGGDEEKLAHIIESPVEKVLWAAGVIAIQFFIPPASDETGAIQDVVERFLNIRKSDEECKGGDWDKMQVGLDVIYLVLYGSSIIFK